MTKHNQYLITPEDIIKSYMIGVFPMSLNRKDNNTFFVEPKIRAVIPIQKFHFSKTLKRLIKKNPFKITVDKAFPEVIHKCATINRTETWINSEIQDLFISLNKMKYAHSIECWKDNILVGGIYGLAIGGVFFAESMFSSISNGSKIALSNLVARLWKTGFQLLDVQFMNEHLYQFGAFEISQFEFKNKLAISLNHKADFYSLEFNDEVSFECLSSFVQDSIDIS